MQVKENQGMSRQENKNNRIIIFGGTFDPPHLGHLIIAEQAREQPGCDYLLLMPAGIPPHKGTGSVSPAEIRLEMLDRAVDNNPGLVVSRYEIERSGASYTARTLRHFLKRFTGVSLIIGADSLAEIFTWREPEFILTRGQLLVAPRPGYDIEELLKQDSLQDYRERIVPLDTGLMEISSSQIRKRAARGQSLRYLVPESVREYIGEQGLYEL